MMTLQQASIFFYGGTAFFALAIALRLRADFSTLTPRDKSLASTAVGVSATIAVASWCIILLEIISQTYFALKAALT